jgi:hypothetical protein
MSKTPRTDAHQSDCLKTGGRSCDMGRNAYWLARKLEEENGEMMEILLDLAKYPIATTYPDSPCIEREDMKLIKAAIAKATQV